MTWQTSNLLVANGTEMKARQVPETLNLKILCLQVQETLKLK
jgi:hypothetical protein